MPMFAIYTNVCKDAVPDSLLGDLTQQLAKATGKPAQVRAGSGASTCAAGPAGGAAERPGATSAPAGPGAGGPRPPRERLPHSAAAAPLLRGKELVPVPRRGAECPDARPLPGAAVGPAGARRSRSRGCAAPVLAVAIRAAELRSGADAPGQRLGQTERSEQLPPAQPWDTAPPGPDRGSARRPI